MIDPLVEDLISPAEATRIFPKGPNGKYPHVSKIYRLMKVGYRGVILDSLNTPGKSTSRQAVARFLRRISDTSASAIPSNRSPGARERANHDVERELDQLGI